MLFAAQILTHIVCYYCLPICFVLRLSIHVESMIIKKERNSLILSKIMTDESYSISAKSWTKAADSLSKVGFMDGAADGQKATFQSSFDTGYQQGFHFGFELGKTEANVYFHNKEKPNELQLRDPRRLNCQICLNSISAQEDIVNLFNFQKEKNGQYFQKAEEVTKKSQSAKQITEEGK